MLVLTYSGLTGIGGKKEEIMIVNGEVVKFKYPGIIYDNYIYRGQCTIKMHWGMIVGKMSNWFGECMGNNMVSHTSISFLSSMYWSEFISGAEIFLLNDEPSMKVWKNLDRLLICNSHINEQSCDIPKRTRKRNISHILSKYYKKRVCTT